MPDQDSDLGTMSSPDEISRRIRHNFGLSRIDIEMDIFDNNEMPDVLARLKSARPAEKSLWAYRLLAATTSGSSLYLLLAPLALLSLRR